MVYFTYCLTSLFEYKVHEVREFFFFFSWFGATFLAPRTRQAIVGSKDRLSTGM